MNKKLLIGTGVFMALAMTLVFAVPQAKAESPNILTGRNLTVGSSGQDVVVLQGLLTELGFLNVPAGIPLGYFGSLTQSALTHYETSVDVSPGGYFGPSDKAAMRAQFIKLGWLNWLGWQ